MLEFFNDVRSKLIQWNLGLPVGFLTLVASEEEWLCAGGQNDVGIELFRDESLRCEGAPW